MIPNKHDPQRFTSTHPELDHAFLINAYTILQEAHQALIARGLAQVEDAQLDDDGRGDVADRATLEDLSQTHDRLRDTDRPRARAILDALSRIEQGCYGICIDCDEPIALARLRAIPEVARCIECAEQYERSQRSTKLRPGLLDEFDPL
jgi:DnaK suppressor protein